MLKGNVIINNQNWLKQLQQQRAIAVVRSNQRDVAQQMALAVAAGEMQLIEITWNTDQAAELINQLRSELPNCTIGTGTVVNLQQLQEAQMAGAQFVFTPHVDRTLIQASVEMGLPIIPGALSPTEIVTAWNFGASCVKVFPIQAVGGTSYIKALQAPLGNIPLIPTGGVTLDNAQAFIAAGAIAVGLAGDLFPKQVVAAGNWQAITEGAKMLMQRLRTLTNEGSSCS